MAAGPWDYECAVVGAGPGGLVSAIYLKRFRRKIALFQSGKPRAAWIPRTYNVLGYYGGVSGAELLARLGRQLGSVGVDRIRAEAVVRRWRDGFEIEAEGRAVKARKVIVSTGILDNQPDVPNVPGLRRRGLLRYCSICDAYEYRNDLVTVLARDRAGIDKALFLTTFTRRLQVAVPEDLAISPACLKRLNGACVRVLRGRIEALEPSSSSRGLWICLEGQRPVYTKVAYVALGCRVKDSAFGRLKGLRRSKDGFLIATTEQRTSVPGLFAVGDCVNQIGQIAVAAGQAAVAATTIHNDLFD